MVTFIVWEHENSEPHIRVIPMSLAWNLGNKGGFYKAQIINEFGIVDYEFKA